MRFLLNLLDNTIKYTEKGTITINTNIDKNMIHISVQDTGIGIKKEEREKLFQKYEQLRKQTSGTGLSLAICKQIINAHNGKI